MRTFISMIIVSVVALFIWPVYLWVGAIWGTLGSQANINPVHMGMFGMFVFWWVGVLMTRSLLGHTSKPVTVVLSPASMQETKDDAIRDKWAAAFGSGVTTLPVASRETSNPIYIRNDRLRYTIIGIVTVMIVSIVVTIVKSS